MSVLRIGIAGLGVVGGGLLDILVNHGERLHRAGTRFEIAGVSARNRHRDRGVSLDGYEWFDDPVALAKSDGIDILVELIGGADGSALAAVEAALTSGKHVVTANKALIAEHGQKLADLAEENDVSLCYEAAVAGGIPAIRAVREGAAGATISRIAAILNGTCNYILTEMESTGASYQDALADAQRLGFAEADPAFDVGGFDAAHKLAILATIAFDTRVDFHALSVSGIEEVASEDVAAARELGYRIRLLALASADESGIELKVHPALVQASHVIARTVGPENVLLIDSEPLGRLTLAGPGAGAGPTASAVIADLVAIARKAGGPVFNSPVSQMRSLALKQPEQEISRFYLRVRLKDVPGAIAGITEKLASQDISIDSLLQPSVETAGLTEAMVVLTTHRTSLASITSAAGEIARQPFAVGDPSIIRIQDF